ncbi:MAG: hypothetical protein FD144_72 [Rhodospirillaceae bacterium]|nr:MAG: hypothetical protein FD144_72 [Rhodospirillaceae bacterium]
MVLVMGERSLRSASEAPRIDWYKRTLETIQVLAVIAGFSLTILQIGKIQESTDLAAWNSVSSEWLKVDQYFLQNPEMRKYFYSGASIAHDHMDHARVEGAANYVLNFLDYAIATSDHIVKKYPDSVTFIQPDAWKAYVKATYFKSPAICELFGKLSAGYSAGTRNLAREMCP